MRQSTKKIQTFDRYYNIDEIVKEQMLNERLAKASQKPRLTSVERTHGRNLFEQGKESYFQEYFYDIKLENQDIKPIGPFEDPTTTYSFQIV